MAWAIITIYTSICAQMDPQQLPKTSKLYSRCKKCDIENTLEDGCVPPPLVARRLTESVAYNERIGESKVVQRIWKIHGWELGIDFKGFPLGSSIKRKHAIYIIIENQFKVV